MTEELEEKEETKESGNPARRWPLIAAAIVGLVFSLLHGAVCYSWTNSRSSFVVPLVGFVACVAYMAFLLRSKKDVEARPERLWLLLAAVLGVIYAVVLPVGGSPDENYHYARTYAYSDILLGQNWDAKGMGMRVCDCDLMVGNDEHVSLDDYEDALDEPSIFASGSEARVVYVKIPRGLGITSNWPQVRLPAAIGIALGRLIGLNATITWLLGELFSVAYFLALVWWAIRVTPVGKNAFMVASLLPMTLSLAASYSYDAGMIGLAFLLTAFCLKAVYGEGPISRGDMVAIIVLTALLVPAKAIYSLIGFLALWTPAKRFSSRKQCIGFKCAIICGLLAMLVVSQFANLAAMASDSRGSGDVDFYTIGWLVNHPISAAVLFARTLGICFADWICMMVTGPIGALQGSLSMPQALTFAFLGLVAYACLPSKSDDAVLPARTRIVMGVLVVIMLGAIMLSMAVGWTPMGDSLIKGVQGRYLLPFLPLAMLAVRPRTIRIEGEGPISSQTFVALSSSAALSAISVACVYAGVLMG
jgi:uncharacterized membrane protein